MEYEESLGQIESLLHGYVAKYNNFKTCSRFEDWAEAHILICSPSEAKALSYFLIWVRQQNSHASSRLILGVGPHDLEEVLLAVIPKATEKS